METIQKRESWNKGKLIGQKPRSSRKTYGQSGFIFRTNTRSGIWGCGQKLGLLGGSPCFHTKSVFER